MVVLVLLLVVFMYGAVVQVAYASSRSTERNDVRTVREVGVPSDGSTGGTSGSQQGGESGGNGEAGDSSSDNEELDKAAAQELLDELYQNGPDEGDFPSESDLYVDTTSPTDPNFLTVLDTALTRFRNR